MSVYEQEVIEGMLDECLQLLWLDDHPYTQWEVEFIESIEDQADGGTLTQQQQLKLRQIWGRRVVGWDKG